MCSTQHSRVQCMHIRRAVVRQGPALEVGPTVLVRVELGCVGWQVFQVNPPAATQPTSQQAALVSLEVVPDDHDPAAQVSQQVTQEVDDLLLPDVPVQMELQVPAQATPAGRDRQACDGREAAIVPDAVAQDRRLAPRSPTALQQRLQQKARFVNEYKVRVRSGHAAFDAWPVVLQPVGDSRFVTFQCATLGLLRGKNPSRPSGAESRRRGNGRRIAAPRPARCADRSKDRFGTRRRRRLSASTGPGCASAGPSVWAVARMRGKPSAPPRPGADAAAATRRRSEVWCRADGRSPSGPGLAATRPRPAAAAAPTALKYHVVSCFTASAPNDDEL